MQVRWKTLMTQTILWLMAEIILGLMGLDDLADYGEYRFSATRCVPSSQVITLA